LGVFAALDQRIATHITNSRRWIWLTLHGTSVTTWPWSGVPIRCLLFAEFGIKQIIPSPGLCRAARAPAVRESESHSVRLIESA
jgi:hypothetical protein